MRLTGKWIGAALLFALAPPAAAQSAIATMTEAQIKPLLVGNWTVDIGFGPAAMTITDVQAGQISVSGKAMLDYKALFIRRGTLEGDKVALNFNSGNLVGTLTTPAHMEGDVAYRGDTTSGTLHWHADKVVR